MLSVRLFFVLMAWLVSSASAQLLKPGEIIYSRATQGGDCLTAAIWVVGPDGSNDRFITNGLHPRISPDGRYLLFKRFNATTACAPFTNGAPEFWIREIATGRENMIYQDFGISEGEYFSPETNRADKQIIIDDGDSICTMNVDASSRSCVSPPGLSPINSPGYMSVRGNDGLIVMQNFGGNISQNGIYTLNYDDFSNIQKIPNTLSGDVDPAWSNDGQNIAYAFSPGGRGQPYWFTNIFKIRPDGTGKTQLTNVNLPASGEGFSYSLVWTLDNTILLNAAKLNGVAGIYKIDANGGGVIGMIPITPGSVPEWVGGIVPAYGEKQVASFGGGVTSGDMYTLVDTVGQGFAGQTSVGDSYNFQSGFWTIDGPTPTPTGSPTATPTTSPTFTPTATPTFTPTTTPTFTPTATPTATPTFTPTATPTSTPTATPTSTPDRPAAYDYDADRKTDISLFRPSDGAWYLQRSRDGLYGMLFGFGDDRIAPADYDRDGKTDIAVYRPSSGIWYVFNSSDGTFSYFVFGVPEDLPTPADYDGDRKADISVYRPSTGTWYRQNSSDGSFFGMQFGQSGDKPAVGDYDGDGKADIAVFRPADGAWYWVESSDSSSHGEQFGVSDDLIVPGDYDGDGKSDLAVFRPSNGFWYARNSNGSVYTAYPFGLSEDIPAPGDFDGDGRSDYSVFRPSDGNWYRINSLDQSFFAYHFGQSGDKPTQSAFMY